MFLLFDFGEYYVFVQEKIVFSIGGFIILMTTSLSKLIMPFLCYFVLLILSVFEKDIN